MTSGVNIFEPVVDYKEDGSIASLALRQTCDLRGKNRLRRHKADVAVYDEELNVYYIKDVMVDEKQEINPLEIPFGGKVSAIVVNVNDHAYAKLRFDERTLATFVTSLYKIQDPVTRGQVWRSLWYLVMDRKMSSL